MVLSPWETASLSSWTQEKVPKSAHGFLLSATAKGFRYLLFTIPLSFDMTGKGADQGQEELSY